MNALALLTHAAGSEPPHWSAHGYLSALAQTAPDVVWPLDEGGTPNDRGVAGGAGRVAILELRS